MITVDPEFEKLIPPLSAEEYKQLEENCVKEGIREPLIVWHTPGNDILIDGHNRFRIAAKHSLKCEFRKMNFKNRNDAMIWMIKNQLGRRNISAYYRSILAMKLKPAIEKQAKAKQATHTEQGYQKSDKAVNTNKELAKAAGVSHDTIHKVQVIEEKAPEEVKTAARKGTISINEAYKQTVNKITTKPRDVVKEAKERHEQFKEAKQEKVVSFQEAQQDREDKELLSIDLYKEICHATDCFDKLSILKNSDDFEELFDSMDPHSYGDLLNRLTRCYRTVLNFQRMIVERREDG